MNARSTALHCLALWASLALAGTASTRAVELSTQCPPSFERLVDGTCALRTLYDTYARIDGHGGARTALPPVRQGFTPGQIDLGRHLFFDRLLSADGRSSCASCHQPSRGLSDGRATASGFGGAALTRRTPTLWNVGFADRLFWDGRATTLEAQAEGPLFSANEMGNTHEGLLARMNASAEYRRLFAQAFGRAAEAPIALPEIETSLAAFQSTLISLNSRYDRYVHGDASAMSPQEVRGLNVFRGFVARCTQCHTPPLFTNFQLAVIGSPPSPGHIVDVGAGAFSEDPLLRGAFKVPTLRNVTRTGPRYFHAGQLKSLDEAVSFYNARRGHALPAGERQAIHWHVHMLKPQLDPADVKAIVAFLGALEDESMLPAVPTTVPSGMPVIFPGDRK
ncbi:cytochrome-c peroxidase [Roseateles sp.]|uniref:cytochrome-c peroxidase n=1 Tax=Roseateles sp. TaxID=1971397 RepID=UPI0039ECA20D